ncbi:response regulator transcription factor [Clostridium sp.]|uniref:response regulator transcription factor n=1 Tax=Clostridium sp. TaxID=1506 RepID=UPI0026DCBD98|nr:response regulator transcription factor [Clostridium sp.]MDO5039149.1 response regulator transcription factor [Clostridium sp.]
MKNIGEERILIIEDDQDINGLIYRILTKEGYNVTQAFSGSEGRLCIELYDYDAVLIDLMLPGISGEDIIKKIREEKFMPIIVISAKTSQIDKVNALKIGADDFISKPFNIEELLARLEAQLRRYKKFPQEKFEEEVVLRYKEIELDKEKLEVKVKGELIPLTAKELSILKLLLENPNKVFTKANLFESVWNEEFLGDDNTINVHISNIRSKINKIDKENDYIKTIWGIGFKLQ